MAEGKPVPMRLRRNGVVEIGGYQFKVEASQVVNVLNNHIDKTQTVDIQLTLVRDITDQEIDKR